MNKEGRKFRLGCACDVVDKQPEWMQKAKTNKKPRFAASKKAGESGRPKFGKHLLSLSHHGRRG
jgi:hypothetical protein